MKKSIAMLLAVVLLVSIIGTALAACSHSWDQLISLKRRGVIKTVTIAYQHGCINLSNPHTHKRTYYRETIRTYMCSRCGQTRSFVTANEYVEECPKH